MSHNQSRNQTNSIISRGRGGQPEEEEGGDINNSIIMVVAKDNDDDDDSNEGRLSLRAPIRQPEPAPPNTEFVEEYCRAGAVAAPWPRHSGRP